jgi:ankyrin repeat protein
MLENKNKPFNISPIYLACSSRNENFEIFKLVYDKLKEKDLLKTTLMKQDDEKRTILELAIERGHLKIIDLILSEYPSKKLPDINGNFIIHHAAKFGTKELFDLLVKHDAVSLKSNINDENPIHLATIYNRYDFIRSLLEYEKTKESGSKSLVERKNNKHFTPLQLAIMKRHDKCVKEIIKSDKIDLNVKEAENNYSIYHLCVIYSDFESLNILLNKNERKYQEPLYIKSRNDETPFHLACQLGQIESVKLIMDKLNNVAIQTIEPFLKSQNKDGRTCLHLACMYGQYNIMDYFLNHLRINYFLEITDNQSNTCLLTAAESGYERIVELLINNGANMKAQNKDKSNALEISCRKSYFEMAKILIDKMDIHEDVNSNSGFKSLLHLATDEGAHEIVKLLLSRGAFIDTLNENKQNCLDVAIDRGYSDVIKVLLNDKNWLKLFQNNDNQEQMKKSFLSNIFKKSKKNKNNYENRQINAMSDKKMWDLIQILLDNCHLSRNVKVKNKFKDSYDFRVLDPPVFNDIKRHPLMVIANSGQEQLLVHKTTANLLRLKWKIPRLIYLFNLLFHLAFLVLFSIYAMELVDISKLQVNSNSSDLDNNTNSVYYPYLIAILSFISFTMILELILFGWFSYFSSPETWLEITYVVFAFLSVTTLVNLHDKISFCSISLIFTYLHYAFLINKLRFFGIYILAFRGTLKNSFKFFPLFILIYLGFFFSFRVRTGISDLTYFNDTTSGSFIAGLTLMMGNYNNEQMGFDTSAINFLLYAFFIIIVSIIILNLFVGIAVGEITQLLAAANVQQISMRIIFVLQVQSALKFTRISNCSRKLLNMNYGFYSYELNESWLSKLIDKILYNLNKRLKKSHPVIDLVEPIEKLEDKIDQIMLNFEHECNKMQSNILNQLKYIESQNRIAQNRIQDKLNESSRKALNMYDSSSSDNKIGSNNENDSNFKELNDINSTDLDFNSFLVLKLGSISEAFSQTFRVLEYNLFQQNMKLVDLLNLINQNMNNQKYVERDEFQYFISKTLSQENKLESYENVFDLLFEQLSKIENKLDSIIEPIN